MPLEDLVVLIELATRGLSPDLVLLFDLPVELAASRRGKELDRMESEAIEFHERVRQGYLAQAAAEPDRWVVIDATRSLDEVSLAVDEEVTRRGWR